jgi:hypothetical protein
MKYVNSKGILKNASCYVPKNLKLYENMPEAQN